MELDFNLDSAERLQIEVDNTTNNYAKVVGNKLLELFKEDKTLESAYKDRKVTLEKVWNYIERQAQAKAVNGCAMIEDKEVFGWGIHFVLDEPIENKEETQVIPEKPQEVNRVVFEDKPKASKQKKEKVNTGVEQLLLF